MIFNTRCHIFLAQTCTLSILAVLLGSTTPTQAQIPGISPAVPPANPSSLDNNTLLRGQVKTNIVPAEKLLSQGKYADAEGLFRELLVVNPQDLHATVGLGLALANQFKLDGADQLFDRVLSQDPNNAQAYAGKATVLLNRLQSSSGTIRSQKDSILQQAEQYANQACRLAPANAEGHYALGQVYKEQGHTNEAASEFRNAINFDPQMSFAYSSLGSIKLDQNSLAEAGENFKRAIELNSGNSTAHYGLGTTYLKQGRTDDAIQELNTSLYQFPNSWPVRMALGQAYESQGNSAAAIKEYQLSTLIKPENAEPYLCMAKIREERGDLELALADLHSGLTQAPYDLTLRERIADITLRLEKPDDAITAYRTILQMSPNNPQAVKGLSQALYQKAQKAAVGAMLASNDYESAMSTLNEAIKLNPSDMELLLAKAKLMSLSGTKPDLSKMAQPTNDGEKVAYAEALLASGEFQKESDMLKSVVNDQTDAKQTFALADIAVMIRDLDNAETAYKKALSLGTSLPGASERGQRGLDQISQLRKNAQDNLTVANELSKKKQFDGAAAKYREAISSNPRLASARLGLARALEKTPKASSSMLDEAVQQYQYYLTLQTDLPEKDRKNLVSSCAKLTEKAAKLKQKESISKR